MSLYSDLNEVLTPYAQRIKGLGSQISEVNESLDDVRADLGDLSELETETKTDLVSAINEAAKSGGVGSHALPVLYLYGDENEIQTNWNNESKAKMNFRYVFHNLNKNKQKNGWCKLSLQGNATLQYPKHNFNIQFYKDAGFTTKDKVDYMDLTDDKHPKWTIKANYNDYSQARNVVSARLWGDVVHCRTGMSSALSDAPNHGAIDGHPVTLYMNDVYYGLYMFNMSKSDWMIGIDEDNPAHCVISSNIATDSTKWLTTGLSGWELEIPDEWQTITNEDETTTSVQAGFAALQTFVQTATDEEFYSDLGNYLDVSSAIDYLIYSFCICNADSMNKNQFLVTWNAGQTWAFSAYDMDQTFGAGFTSSIPYNHDLFSTHPNHLFERLIANFYNEILARYAVLRGSVFSTSYVQRELEIFFNEIPTGEREIDKDLYPGIMFQSSSSLEWLQEFTQNRLQYCDVYFSHIDPSYVPCTGVAISDSTVSFNALTTKQLTATKTPSNASDPITWASSDSSVVTVSETGLITAKANGTATVTATCGNYSASCSVSVTLITRGDVDYTIDGFTNATWSVGGIYNTDTGAFEEVSNEHYTDKFHLQDCLYTLTGGTYAVLYAWDQNGNYKGCFGENSPIIFSARSDYLYAAKSYNRHDNITLLPINHSATEGSGNVVTVNSITRYVNGYAYNNTINAQFTGLITSTSGTLNYDAVDWIWCDELVMFKGVQKPSSLPNSIVVYINGSGSNVEVWLYTAEYTTTDSLNAYLAEHPIMLVLNA